MSKTLESIHADGNDYIGRRVLATYSDGSFITLGWLAKANDGGLAFVAGFDPRPLLTADHLRTVAALLDEANGADDEPDDVMDAEIACGSTYDGLDCELPDGHAGLHESTHTVTWVDGTPT